MGFRIIPERQEQRFWAKIDKETSPIGCWLWTRNLSDFGHGVVRVNKVLWRAHRYMWTRVNGPIPEGLCVLHKCDVPACVNPEHLFLGTKKDNTQDMMRKQRNAWVVHPGEESGVAKLTWEQVAEIRRLYGPPRGKGKAGPIPQWKLGQMFGVGQVEIGNVVRREVWKEPPMNDSELLLSVGGE